MRYQAGKGHALPMNHLAVGAKTKHYKNNLKKNLLTIEINDCVEMMEIALIILLLTEMSSEIFICNISYFTGKKNENVF